MRVLHGDEKRQRDEAIAALGRVVAELRWGQPGDEPEWYGRIDGLVVRGNLDLVNHEIHLSMEAVAERDPGGLLAKLPEGKVGAGFATGDPEFDRMVALEAAPRDLALAFFDEPARREWLQLSRRGLFATEVRDGRVELKLVIPSESDGNFVELDATVARAAAWLVAAVGKIPELPARVDAAAPGAGSDPYRGAATGGDARERQRVREQERAALLATWKRRENVGCTIGLLVMGGAVFGCVMLIRNCV